MVTQLPKEGQAVGDHSTPGIQEGQTDNLQAGQAVVVEEEEEEEEKGGRATPQHLLEEVGRHLLEEVRRSQAPGRSRAAAPAGSSRADRGNSACRRPGRTEGARQGESLEADGRHCEVAGRPIGIRASDLMFRYGQYKHLFVLIVYSCLMFHSLMALTPYVPIASVKCARRKVKATKAYRPRKWHAFHPSLPRVACSQQSSPQGIQRSY